MELESSKKSSILGADMDFYVTAYNAKPVNRNKPMNNWCNAYTKMMYALAKMYCNIDLQSVVSEGLRPLDEKSGGCNPQDTTGYNPMLQKDAPLVVDLATITRVIIFANDLPCITVKRAIEVGLLSSVKGYELLTAEM